MILERHIWLSFSCFLPHEVACPVISDSFPSWPWGLLWGLYFLLLPELLFHFALELALPLLEGLLQWAMIPKRLMKETLSSTGSTIEHEYRFPNFSLQLLPMFQKTWQSSTLPGKETDVCAFPRPCSNGEKRSSKVREDGSNL